MVASVSSWVSKWLPVLMATVMVFAAAGARFLRAQRPFAYGGTLLHRKGSATVQATGSRPLDRALEAIRTEYGWLVDYEDPPYQGPYGLGSIPWPAHPGLKWVVPASGSFSSTYPENSKTWSSPAAQQLVLQKILSDYDMSGNPGRFVVRQQSDGSMDVVGVGVRDSSGDITSLTPILDTPISIAAGTRDGMTTLSLIADAVSRASGTEVDVGSPVNALAEASVTTAGGQASARSLLLQAVDAARVKLVWELRYDPQTKSYGLSVLLAMRAQYDAFGNRTLVPVAVPPVPGG